MADENRLLLLAEQVSSLDADIGPYSAQAWLVAAIDALAHVIVDLADGRRSAGVHVPVLALALTTPQTGSSSAVDADRASCAAAAGELRRVHAALRVCLAEPDGLPPGLAADTVSATLMLSEALREVAGTPAQDPRRRAVRAGAHRSIRAAYRLVQPPRYGGDDPSSTRTDDSKAHR